MNLLLCNDDGINSPGLLSLAKELIHLGDIYIFAPDTERSAASSSLTLMQPLRANNVTFPINVTEAYAISGTPTDCAKLGLSILEEKKVNIDMIISGINKGPNMCCDITYSGTVGAAIEGAFNNILSVAVSLNSYDRNSDFSIAAKYGKICIEKIINKPLPHNIVYNINVPYIPDSEIKGIKVTRVGKIIYKGGYEKRTDTFGKPYYWAKGRPVIIDESDETDVVAVKNGWVSITPLSIDATNKNVMEQLYGFF